MNEKAYKGLEKSGLLKRVMNIDEFVANLLNKPSQKKIEKWQDKAQEFIKANQGAAIKYAKVMQECLTNPEKKGHFKGIYISKILPFW